MSEALRTDLRPFLEPATAVVLGASPRSGVAGQFVRNLVAGGARVTGTHPANRANTSRTSFRSWAAR